MTYKETVDYILRALPMYQLVGYAAYKADLRNALRLDEYFKYPHRAFKSIHVAGTNGKGSVCHMLAAVLQAAGYKTGLFTSPHLLDFRERIKVNGTNIPKKYVTGFIARHQKIIEKINPSFFEISVFMAFDYFRETAVDIAVIEVGLGGRLDTTNIISPEVSVITNIGHDHTQILGNTLPEIAVEKAGIIKPETPVIISETQEETKTVFTDLARKLKSPIWFTDEHYVPEHQIDHSNRTSTWKFNKCSPWHFNSITLDLMGRCQGKNLSAVLMTLSVLSERGITVTKESIQTGLCSVIRSTGLQGRWQIIKQKPLVICDTAHNREGFEQVIDQIGSVRYERLLFVLGFVTDKDVNTIVEILPREAFYYLCEPEVPRAMKLDELEKYFISGNLNYTKYTSALKAYDSASRKASLGDIIYVGGSTFVVADFLKRKKRIISFF